MYLPQPLGSSITVLVWLLASTTSAKDFFGIGIRMKEPKCAYACKSGIVVPLNCTAASLVGAGNIKELQSSPGWKVVSPAPPACLAQNNFYLDTFAYCLKSRCPEESPLALNDFWSQQFPKDAALPAPFYTDVISHLLKTPTQELNSTTLLNYTGILPDKAYLAVYNGIHSNNVAEYTNSYYSFILFLSGAILPIALSLLRLLPWPSPWVTTFNGFIIDPPMVDPKFTTYLSKFFVIPSRGQAIFIAYLWIINITLSATGFEILTPNANGEQSKLLLKFVANRLGVLTMSNVPLVILYAGRNTILLWLTNWSRNTFLLLHRWTAMICVLHAALHALVYLYFAHHQPGWSKDYNSSYWIFGTLAMIAFTVLILSSVKPVRQWAYEVFITAHIVLAILALVGSYRHIIDKSGVKTGFQNWILLASAIWAFDRVIRVVRLLSSGPRRAFITHIDEDYYRVDIPGTSAVGHVFLHFPTISKWCIWESHPFSVAAIAYCKKNNTSAPPSIITSNEMIEVKSPETMDAAAPPVASSDSQQSDVSSRDLGIVLLVRKQNGITLKLANHNWGPNGLPIFLEASYGHNMLSLHDNNFTPTPAFPNLICIAGGVGITGVLPFLARFNAAASPSSSRRLYWGVRTEPLVHAVEDILGLQFLPPDANEGTAWRHVQINVSVGERLEFRTLLEKDLGMNRGGTIVFVCGPRAMVDDVRSVVSALSRHSHDDGESTVLKLMVDSFDW